MATQRNPLKDQGQGKPSTREEADKVDKGPEDPGWHQAAQGEPRRGQAGTRHPSQHGGLRADEARTTDSSTGTKKRGPSPSDEPGSARTGTLPHQGDSRRTGKTGNDRQT